MIRAREESSLRSPGFGAAEPLPIGLWTLTSQARDSPARERHQLICYERLEGKPSQVARRVLTPLSGILGTRSVGKPAMKLWRR